MFKITFHNTTKTTLNKYITKTKSKLSHVPLSISSSSLGGVNGTKLMVHGLMISRIGDVSRELRDGRGPLRRCDARARGAAAAPEIIRLVGLIPSSALIRLSRYPS